MFSDSMDLSFTLKRKLVFWMFLVIFVLASIEGLSAVALFLLSANDPGKSLGDARRAVADEIHARTNVTTRQFRDEARLLNRTLVEPNPYRWYGMPRHFEGKYFQTDDFGFRIDRTRVDPRTQKIAFFGGSTIFSVTTRIEHSIPAIVGEALDPNTAQALNFGVIGYSISAELALFLEIARRELPDVVVFYDGVNEVGRYVESLQDGADDAFLDVFGYPFMDAYESAIHNLIVGGGFLVRYQPYFYVHH